MNREDNELLEVAAQWAPFGGASAGDVFETFGMTLDRYHRRLRQILRARGIHPPIDGTVFTAAREIEGRSLGEPASPDRGGRADRGGAQRYRVRLDAGAQRALRQ